MPQKPTGLRLQPGDPDPHLQIYFFQKKTDARLEFKIAGEEIRKQINISHHKK